MIIHYETEDMTSEGFKISGVVPVLDEVLTLLSITDESYLLELQSLYEEETSTSEILDMLGSLFGLRRNLSVSYMNGGTLTTEELSLDDTDFLTYIRCQIIKNNFDGSYKQFKKYYELAGLDIGIRTWSTDSSIPQAHASLYLIGTAGTSTQISTNLRKLFISGNLTIASAGIEYEYSNIDITTALVWSGIGKDGQVYEGENVWGGYDENGQLVQGEGVWI